VPEILLIITVVMLRKRIFFLIALVCSLPGCEKDETSNGTLELLQVFVGTTEINLTGTVSNDLPADRSIALIFSLPLDKTAAVNAIMLKNSNGQAITADLSFSSQDKTVIIHPAGTLTSNTTYTLEVSDALTGAKGERFASTEVSFKTAIGSLTITSATVGGSAIGGTNRITDVPLELTMIINFSDPIDPGTLEAAAGLAGPEAPVLQFSVSNSNRTVTITSAAPLQHLSQYKFELSASLKGSQGESFSEFSAAFYTTTSDIPQWPVITDEELLSKVQQQTFAYFWDFAQPASGMARERNTSGDLVTSGGSGFGLMAIIVGIERNFITRTEGLDRLNKILTFLESADRFHGAWSHWINGNTGDVIPFGADDNGGDLVETSFLVEGLLTFRQYLNPGNTAEQDLIERINTLWETVEWDWYTRGGQNVLYWHWSPDKEWIMNHTIQGYNECLITYVLAASSPSHTINASVYHQGWANSGGIANGKSFYNLILPLGQDYGGPLFFTHYSFLGLDPRNLSDAYANYWQQNVRHSLINHAYCAANPKSFVGYSDENWGLTASDNHLGYNAHSPTNDLGVITPTAALSSFPYTPEESMKAMKFFYYKLGDRLWGDYGFYDAFNITAGWAASSYLAIDQGPIIVMIENHRSGLLWNLFMSAPEVQSGLTKLGFTY
jgi:hypothetical protein